MHVGFAGPRFVVGMNVVGSGVLVLVHVPEVPVGMTVGVDEVGG